jgi:hypothetical protein
MKWMDHHIFKEIDYLPQVQKQLPDARFTALHLQSEPVDRLRR